MQMLSFYAWVKMRMRKALVIPETWLLPDEQVDLAKCCR